MGKKVLLGLLLPFVFTISSPAARAIDTDRGWTNEGNGGYPTARLDPECQPSRGFGCRAWDEYTWVSYDYSSRVASLVPSGSRYIDGENGAFGDWYGMVPRSPRFFYSPQGGGGGIWVDHYYQLADGLCAAEYNHLYNNPPRPPRNGRNPYLHHATFHSDIQFSTRYPWNDTGNHSSGNCEIKSVLLHELGHTLGLGHSAYTNQSMYHVASKAVYWPQGGDRNGIECTYELWDCHAYP